MKLQIVIISSIFILGGQAVLKRTPSGLSVAPPISTPQPFIKKPKAFEIVEDIHNAVNTGGVGGIIDGGKYIRANILKDPLPRDVLTELNSTLAKAAAEMVRIVPPVCGPGENAGVNYSVDNLVADKITPFFCTGKTSVRFVSLRTVPGYDQYTCHELLLFAQEIAVTLLDGTTDKPAGGPDIPFLPYSENGTAAGTSKTQWIGYRYSTLLGNLSPLGLVLGIDDGCQNIQSSAAFCCGPQAVA
ncbi:hypothetical protein TWF694_000284 [Orbilia ellipsospora]|uniref:Uncharacterized protein n=1 Tax=Orbilia ellipsospora TaxID=2528407 RepID=A0AAV9XNH6_9PEZI